MKVMSYHDINIHKSPKCIFSVYYLRIYDYMLSEPKNNVFPIVHVYNIVICFQLYHNPQIPNV